MAVHLKITHRLFAAFFLILVIVVGAMFLAKSLFSYNFKNYIHQVEMEQLNVLATSLQEEFQRQGSWEGIASDATSWEKRLSIASEMRKIIPPRGKKARKKRYKVLLSDANLNPVVGTPTPEDSVRLVPVQVEGNVVGWLGMAKWESFHSGSPAVLLEKQTRQTIILGLVMVGLTGLIAYLISRQMVGPIRELTKGTRELANRNFSVRVETGTQDEFGQLANHFNKMAETLSRYEKMRQQWLSDISHELRTPLAVLRGEIEALQDGIRNPTPENLASLHGEVVRISTLIEDLHQLSLSDSNRFYLERSSFDLHALIRESVEGHQALLGKKAIAVCLDANLSGELQVAADPTRMRQVVGNILDNAGKYCDANAELSISTRICERAVQLRFADSGPGVPPEALGSIFDRLYRVDASRNRAFGGSGLGLSICKQIVEDHGGRIWAEQSKKGGLAINIELPMMSI